MDIDEQQRIGDYAPDPRPINRIDSFVSEVDIIIPYHGQYQKLMQLIESIFRLTRSNYYNLCLVDDCSPNSHFISTLEANANKIAQRRKIESNIKFIRTKEQLGFGGACKVGYEATENSYVCFLHSDCVISDSGWLKSMGDVLIRGKSENVRMVSPMTNNPLDGFHGQKGLKSDMSDSYELVPENDYLSLYCFMSHRDLYDKCRGFIKPYRYGYYENQEFAYRMCHYGHRQAVAKNGFIYHKGKSTYNYLLEKHAQVKKIMEKDNRDLCLNDLKSLKNNKHI